MANQTITTSVNYDDASISGLNNGESITINGGTLTINSDVRWNQQAAVFGNISCSATLGGSFYADGTTVWELYFTASTGNVPTQAALGSNGVTGVTSAATGELLRVWATGSLTPATAGGAMPATGWIKLRSKAGNFQAGETVNLPGGATITISSAGQRSWIHLVGTENLAVTGAKIGTTQITGDWYYLGTTNGTDDQTFQFPVADYCPAIQVETAVGSGVYEWWLNGADGVRWGTATQFIATDVRGKYFGSNATTGVITIAKRAVNPCGYKPVSGLNVRIPNVICSSSNSTNWSINTWNTSVVAQRFRGIQTNNGDVSVSNVCSNWYWAFNNANNITFSNCALMPILSIATSTGTTTLSDIGMGCPPAAIPTTSIFVLSALPNGGTVSKVRATLIQGATTNDTLFAMGSVNGFTINDCQFETFGGTGSIDRTTTAYAFSASRCGTQTINNLTIIGSSASFNTYLAPATVAGMVFADKLNGTTTSGTINTTPISVSTSPNFRFTGPLTWFGGLSNVQPYGNIVSIASGSTNCIVEKIGTPAAPLDLGNITSYVANAGGLSSNTIFRQIYTQNTRSTVFYAIGNDSISTTFDNCGSDYADTQIFQGSNTRARGLKASNSVSTQVAMSGCLFTDCFTSATTGRVIFASNAPNAASGSELVTSLGTGSGFSGSGYLVMVNVGDSATWTYSYYLLGHTGFQNTTPTLTGVNTANFTIEFQYDTGSGFNGTWLAATGANLSGIGAINPATGIKLKVRATCNTAAAANALAFIRFDTTTTASAQDTLYPYPYDGTGIISNLLSGSRIQIYNQTTSTELVNTTVSDTSYSYSYYVGTQVAVGDTVRIRVAKLGKLPQTLLAIATSTGFAATANAQDDAIYVSNGVDGLLVTEFVADYPNIQVDISDPDQITTVQRVYAWLRYVETTQSGIAQWFDVVDPTDEVNYEIDVAKLDLKLDNTQATPVLIGGGRLYRSDDMTVIATTSGSIHMDPNRVYLTDGISTTQDAYNNLADTFLRRSTANAEASTFGDPISLKSMYGMVAQGTHNTYVNDATNKLVVTKSNETTVLGTRTISNSPNAQPITGLNSD